MGGNYLEDSVSLQHQQFSHSSTSTSTPGARVLAIPKGIESEFDAAFCKRFMLAESMVTSRSFHEAEAIEVRVVRIIWKVPGDGLHRVADCRGRKECGNRQKE